MLPSLAGMLPVLQTYCYNGSSSEQPELGEWFGQFKLPSGKVPDPRNTDALTEICGPHIGRVHTPAESANASDVGCIFIGVDTRDGIFKCYAAVRLIMSSKTVVIDLLGVHETIRRQKAGSVFYQMVMTNLKPHIVDNLGVDVGYTVSLQSTFDYDSYVRALLDVTHIKTDTHQVIVCAFNKEHIIKKLTGSCRFWAQMGFTKSKLVFSRESGIVDPILIMWKEE